MILSSGSRFITFKQKNRNFFWYPNHVSSDFWQISEVTTTSLSQLCLLAKIKIFLYQRDLEKAIYAFRNLRQDHFNALYVDVIQSLLAHLQLVHNAAATFLRTLVGVRTLLMFSTQCIGFLFVQQQKAEVCWSAYLRCPTDKVLIA